MNKTSTVSIEDLNNSLFELDESANTKMTIAEFNEWIKPNYCNEIDINKVKFQPAKFAPIQEKK